MLLNKNFINLISPIKAYRKSRILFTLILTFKNWFVFLLDRYAKVRKPYKYILRNGLIINLLRNDEIDFSTDLLLDVFVRNDYINIGNKMTLVDIGANIGAFVLYAVYNRENICYAFEPEIDNFKKLQENISVNNLTGKVKLFNLAVSDKCTDTKLYKFESIAHSLVRLGKEYEIVHCIDMKTIIQNNNIEQIDYLKIDCEGAEFDILYSFEQDVFNKIKYICVEYHNYSNKTNYNGLSLLKYLQNNGFKILKHELRQDGLLGIINAVNTN